MNKRVVMAVDDSVSMRQMLRFTLTREGYQVLEAEDGVDALKKLEESSPAIVITDVNMPNMDGITLVRKIRSHPRFRFMPILVLTTEYQQEKKDQGREAGATGWIVKPFKPQQLVHTVEMVLA